ncbi:hypothetical protein [uncultured Arcticibacterium sp.]|uniref:hypothetical protein n=1 Tax=uncultured Arcticibacterium sp. TaxID=2173042 RepID=UPI0030F8D8F2
MIKQVYVLSILLMLTGFSIFAQKGHSNFYISASGGLNKSTAKYKNSQWFEENLSLKPGAGKEVQLEIGQRVCANFWLAGGYSVYYNHYAFNKVDPYLPESEAVSYISKKAGIEFHIKAKYLYPFEKNFAFINYALISNNGMHARTTEFGNTGIIRSFSEYGYLFEATRLRNEVGLGMGHYFGKKQRFALQLEGTYSCFLDYRKSEIIDKMNVKSFAAGLSILYFFKPIEFSKGEG